MEKAHVYLKQTKAGRWIPAGFYLVNWGLWILTAVTAGAWHLLYLAVLPVPALAIYLLRTRRNRP